MRESHADSIPSMSRGLIDVSQLITETVPFTEMDRAFRRAMEPASYRIVVQCT